MRVTTSLILVLLLGLSANVYGDWVMTPPLSQGDEFVSQALDADYQQVLRSWHEGNYKKVIKGCNRLLKKKPKDQALVEELYFLKAESYYQRGKLSKSQATFQKLFQEYPYTHRLSEITRRQLDIACAYLGDHRIKLLGIPLYRTPGKGIEVLEAIFERAPRGPFADDAQVELADYYFGKGNYLEAKERYYLAWFNYPQSNLREWASFQRANSLLLDGQGEDYDATYLVESKHAFEAFLGEFPQSPFAQEAQRAVEGIVSLLAKKDFHTAKYYQKRGQFEAELLYYRSLVSNFPQTAWADEARQAIRRLTRIGASRSL